MGERDRDAVNEILLDVRGGGMDTAARWLDGCLVMLDTVFNVSCDL